MTAIEYSRKDEKLNAILIQMRKCRMPVSVNTLSSCLGIPYSTCVKLVRELEQRGLIARTLSMQWENPRSHTARAFLWQPLAAVTETVL